MASALLPSLSRAFAKIFSRSNIFVPPRTTSQFWASSATHETSTPCLTTIRHLAARSSSSSKRNVKQTKPVVGEIVTSSASQHEEWVKFQKSISVTGFETGQKTELSKVGGKNVSRGGTSSRKKKEKLRLEREKKSTSDLGGGHYPALRYSDEETERLLAEAYAGIPPRAGKRGTRHLKRQRIRMAKKREHHAIYKKQLIKTHERRMVHRSLVAQECRMVREGAEEVRQRDLTYQQYILYRWVTMNSENSVEGHS